MPFCKRCGSEFGTDVKFCTTCGTPTTTPTPSTTEKQPVQFQSLHVSILWWLLPFFFGILGGIVGYFAVKKRNPRTAKKLLLFGVVMTIIIVIVAVVGLGVYYASLPS